MTTDLKDRSEAHDRAYRHRVVHDGCDLRPGRGVRQLDKPMTANPKDKSEERKVGRDFMRGEKGQTLQPSYHLRVGDKEVPSQPAPCSPCGDGDVEQKYHAHGKSEGFEPHPVDSPIGLVPAQSAGASEDALALTRAQKYLGRTPIRGFGFEARDAFQAGYAAALTADIAASVERERRKLQLEATHAEHWKACQQCRDSKLDGSRWVPCDRGAALEAELNKISEELN